MGSNRLRRATVAGYFYPREPAQLRGWLDACETPRPRTTATPQSSSDFSLGAGCRPDQREIRVPRAYPRGSTYGALVPHGGYYASGRIAGETFRAVPIPRRCVVMGPDHLGRGPRWNLLTDGAFQTPLGDVPVDEPLAQALAQACPLFEVDEAAHRAEYAIEVQLPFLQHWGPRDLSIVPLLINSDEPDEIRQAAEAINRVVRQADEPVLLIASADLSAHAAQDVVTRSDAQLVDAIRTIDEDTVFHRVEQLRLHLCGPGVVACLVGAARRLGATSADLIRYATSADAGGDPASATGYGGVLLQ